MLPSTVLFVGSLRNYDDEIVSSKNPSNDHDGNGERSQLERGIRKREKTIRFMSKRSLDDMIDEKMSTSEDAMVRFIWRISSYRSRKHILQMNTFSLLN